MFLTFKHYGCYTNHLLNHICLISVKYGEIRIHLDSENSLLKKKAIRIIYSLDYHGHTSVFFHCSKILQLQDLIIHRTIVMLYKANNHCLEGCVQAFFEPTAAVHKHDTRQYKVFYVKKANTTHRLLSITVRGINIWNGLASEITQLPSLQQFKNRLKSTLLSSYLWTVNTMIKIPLLLLWTESCNSYYNYYAF